MRNLTILIFGTVFVLILSSSQIASASDCDLARSEWLMCEDFEGAGAGWADWFASSSFTECIGCSGGVNNPDRIFLSDDPSHVSDGRYGLHLPATAESNYQGAELIFRTCEGEKRSGCSLVNYERLYLRARLKLAPDHSYVHHFLSIGGTQPDRYWEAYGNAGCRPDGTRHVGATVDFNRDRELFFYTYFPDMHCDSGGYCSGDYVRRICDGCADRGMPCNDGPECCWGNVFRPDPRETLPRGEWVCLEMMVLLNSPGENNGEMTFWLDDELVHSVGGMSWRSIEEVGLNRANLSHYIAVGDSDRPNAISFDDFIVSTSRIGCSFTPEPENDAGVDGGPDSDVNSQPDADVDAGPPIDAGVDADVETRVDSDSRPTDADPSADPPSLSGGGCAVIAATNTSNRPSWLKVLGEFLSL